MWFQKLSIYSVPSPQKGFFLRPPHPSGNSSQASYIYLNFWAFENPSPPRNFQSLPWGKYGFFLGLHNVGMICSTHLRFIGLNAPTFLEIHIWVNTFMYHLPHVHTFLLNIFGPYGPLYHGATLRTLFCMERLHLKVTNFWPFYKPFLAENMLSSYVHLSLKNGSPYPIYLLHLKLYIQLSICVL